MFINFDTIYKYSSKEDLNLYLNSLDISINFVLIYKNLYKFILSTSLQDPSIESDLYKYLLALYSKFKFNQITNINIILLYELFYNFHSFYENIEIESLLKEIIRFKENIDGIELDIISLYLNLDETKREDILRFIKNHDNSSKFISALNIIYNSEYLSCEIKPQILSSSIDSNYPITDWVGN